MNGLGAKAHSAFQDAQTQKVSGKKGKGKIMEVIFLVILKIVLAYFGIGALLAGAYLVMMLRQTDLDNGFVVALVSITAISIMVQYPIYAFDWIISKLERN